LSDALLIHFIIGGFASLGMLYSAGILLKSYMGNKLRISIYLAIANISLAVWAVHSTLYPSVSDLDTACIMYEIGVIASYFGMFMVFVFVERAKKGSVSVSKSFVYGTLFGAISFLLLARVPPPNGFAMNTIPDFGYYAAAQVPFIILQLIFMLSVAIQFTKMTYEMFRHSDVKNKQQPLLLLIGSFIAFYGAMIAIVMVEIFFVPSMILLVVAIGVFIIAISFTKDPRVAYILPYDVVLLGILDETGVPIYTHKFMSVDINESVFTGALSAITTLMKHALGTKESIDLVEAGEYKIILELREKIGGYIITNRGGKILRDGLTNILDNIEKIITEEKDEKTFENETNALVKKYLGFLRGV